jgi:hypothetical protein
LAIKQNHYDFYTARTTMHYASDIYIIKWKHNKRHDAPSHSSDQYIMDPSFSPTLFITQTHQNIIAAHSLSPSTSE